MDVKLLCLGVLTEGDKTGYEIKRRFEEAFSHFFVAGFGSIYPALAELSRREWVRSVNVEQDKRPDKKVYSLTPAGREALVRELAATPPRHKARSEFLVLMYFAHLLPPDRVSEIAEHMIANWNHWLAEIEACMAATGQDDIDRTPGLRFVLGFGQAVVMTMVDYVRTHKGRLLEELEGAASSRDEVAEDRHENQEVLSPRSGHDVGPRGVGGIGAHRRPDRRPA